MLNSGASAEVLCWPLSTPSTCKLCVTGSPVTSPSLLWLVKELLEPEGSARASLVEELSSLELQSCCVFSLSMRALAICIFLLRLFCASSFLFIYRDLTVDKSIFPQFLWKSTMSSICLAMAVVLSDFGIQGTSFASSIKPLLVFFDCDFSWVSVTEFFPNTSAIFSLRGGILLPSSTIRTKAIAEAK